MQTRSTYCIFERGINEQINQSRKYSIWLNFNHRNWFHLEITFLIFISRDGDGTEMDGNAIFKVGYVSNVYTTDCINQ